MQQLLALSLLCGFGHPNIAHFLGTPRDHKSFPHLLLPSGPGAVGTEMVTVGVTHVALLSSLEWAGAWTDVSCPPSPWCHCGPQGHTPSPARAKTSPEPPRAQDEANPACDTQVGSVQAPVPSG